MGEYDGSDSVIIEHVWLNGQLVRALSQKGLPAVEPNGGNTDVFYVYTDQIGAPRAITTNASAPVTIWTWDNNDPFGANLANSDLGNTSVLFAYNVRLPGQYFVPKGFPSVTRNQECIITILGIITLRLEDMLKAILSD